MSAPSGIPEIVRHAKAGMDTAMEHTRREFAAIRSGKATTALLDIVKVEAYGNVMPLNQVASVAAPEARLLVVTPWDKGLAGVIEKAIRDSELGLNPANQGGVIRVPIPALTEERRRDLVKKVRGRVEECKVALRNIRRDVIADMEEAKKEKMISEDDLFRGKDKLQELTEKYYTQADEVGQAKEKEIMEV